MKRFALLLLSATVALLVLAPTLCAQATKPMNLEKTLRENHWKKRVLLVVAPTAKDANFKQQKSLLAAEEVGLEARDFLVLPMLYDQISEADKQFLRREIGFNPPAFAAVLIGKDGGVKEKSSRPMKPEDLFGTVDQMPMRRQEMRRTK